MTDGIRQEVLFFVTMKSTLCALLAFAAVALCADTKKAQRDFEQGVHLEQGGQWAEAYSAFTASLDAAPNAPAYLHRAKAQIALGNPEKAVDDLTEAIRLDPKDPEALRQRAEAYVKMGNHRGVIADLTAVFALGVETSALYALRGAAQEALG